MAHQLTPTRRVAIAPLSGTYHPQRQTGCRSGCRRRFHILRTASRGCRGPVQPGLACELDDWPPAVGPPRGSGGGERAGARARRPVASSSCGNLIMRPDRVPGTARRSALPPGPRVAASGPFVSDL
jgi:hypothetical protein